MAQPDLWRGEAIARRRYALEANEAPVPLSKRLWNLDWRAVLPWRFDDARSDFAVADDVMPFIKEHYPAIFGSKQFEGRFLPSPMTEAKRRFFAEMDYFAFRVDGQLAGVLMAHPTDWTSYYIRSAALLPEHRERRVLTRFLERLDEPLRAAGVERVEAECSPANAPVVRLLAGQGYLVTASVSSERWGLMLRYTKFLSEDAHEAFVRQYTAMSFSRPRESQPPTPDRRRP